MLTLCLILAGIIAIRFLVDWFILYKGWKILHKYPVRSVFQGVAMVGNAWLYSHQLGGIASAIYFQAAWFLFVFDGLMGLRMANWWWYVGNTAGTDKVFHLFKDPITTSIRAKYFFIISSTILLLI